MRRQWTRLVAAAAVLALPACLGNGPEPTAATVVFTSPAPDQTVSGSEISVYGTYAPPGLGDDIWVFVWPGLAPGIGWPQSVDGVGNRTVQRDITGPGSWTVKCNLGGPPQPYELRVYTASRSASARLREILLDWARRNDYPGLTQAELPPGLDLHDSRRISRIQ